MTDAPKDTEGYELSPFLQAYLHGREHDPEIEPGEVATPDHLAIADDLAKLCPPSPMVGNDMLTGRIDSARRIYGRTRRPDISERVAHTFSPIDPDDHPMWGAPLGQAVESGADWLERALAAGHIPSLNGLRASILAIAFRWSEIEAEQLAAADSLTTGYSSSIGNALRQLITLIETCVANCDLAMAIYMIRAREQQPDLVGVFNDDEIAAALRRHLRARDRQESGRRDTALAEYQWSRLERRVIALEDES